MQPRATHRAWPGRRGFTLVEILIVISVIAILVGLLLPALGMARSKARSAVCLSNLRQVGMAIHGYGADEHGFLPSTKGLDRNHPGAYADWTELIGPYLDTEVGGKAELSKVKVLNACPEWPSSPQKIDQPWRVGYGMNSYLDRPASYAHNMWMDFWGPDQRDFTIDALTHTSQRIVIGDSIDWHLLPIRLGGQPGFANTGWNGFGSPGNYGSGEPDRHGDRANYLFVDGHVASLKPEQAALGLLDPERLQ